MSKINTVLGNGTMFLIFINISLQFSYNLVLSAWSISSKCLGVWEICCFAPM